MWYVDQSKLKTLVANIALQCIKRTEAADPGFQDIDSTCKMQWYIIGMLLIILLGMIYLVTNRIKKSSLFGGHLFSNVTKVMLLISDIQSVCTCKPMQNSRKYTFIQNKEEN